MSRNPHDNPVDDEHRVPGESFLERFHRRKTEARQQASSMEPVDATPVVAPAEDGPPDQAVELTDADMPPVDTLTFDSDYSGFLSPKVSEHLRRAALRKLFHSAALNVTDGLDDYAEDFTTFKPLGDLITTDMRHRIEVEARRRAEQLGEALADEGDRPTRDLRQIKGEQPCMAATPTTLPEDAGAKITGEDVEVPPTTVPRGDV